MIVLKWTASKAQVTNMMDAVRDGSLYVEVSKTLSQVVWTCFGSTGTTSPRNGPIKSGIEKNAKYGQMYSICGMFIVAVCADLSPTNVSFI